MNLLPRKKRGGGGGGGRRREEEEEVQSRNSDKLSESSVERGRRRW